MKSSYYLNFPMNNPLWSSPLLDPFIGEMTRWQAITPCTLSDVCTGKQRRFSPPNAMWPAFGAEIHGHNLSIWQHVVILRFFWGAEHIDNTVFPPPFLQQPQVCPA